MKTYNRILSLVICISICLGLLVTPGGKLFTQIAHATNNFYRINGKSVSCNSADAGTNNDYTKAIYKFIWSEEYTNDFVSSDNILKNLSYDQRTLTPDHLKDYVLRCLPGAVIRVESLDKDDITAANGAEFVIPAHDSNGLFIFEKMPEKKEAYYTWEAFCTKYNYLSIRFLKWPGSYYATTNTRNETDYVKPVRALYYDSKYLLSGDDVRWVQQKLTESGYDVSVDGQYSKKTAEAVEEFQKDFEIQVTGIVDSLTADLLEKPLKVPETLEFKLLSGSDMSRGELLTVSWTEVAYAETYHIDLYNTRGNLIETQDDVTGNKISFVIDDAGTYIVKGYAQNEFYAGEEATLEQKVKVHNTFTVSFVDEDGTLLNRQKVAYGQSAATPASPRKEGHSFIGWDKPFTKITSTLTVTAQYTPKVFTVHFNNQNGETIKTENVRYGESATAPDMSAVNGFSGWDKDFSFIEKSTTITAVVTEPTDYCYIEISNPAAKREPDSSGYTVTLTATNNKKSVVVARAVVALKTSTDKFLTLTESSAFKINAATSSSTYSKDISVFVPYPYTATVAEVYIIEDYQKPVPISELCKITEIETSSNCSDYLANEPAEHYGLVDSRTEYSYRTKSFKTSGASTLSGWIKYNTTVARGPAGGWSGWSDNRISEITKEGYKVREVETQNYSWVTGIKTRYWMTHAYAPEWRRHYWNYYHGEEIPRNGVHYKDVVFPVNDWDKMPHILPRSSTRGTYWGYNMGNETGRSTGDGIIWYKYGENYSSKTQYRYRDYDLIYTYYYYKWSNWSEWSTTAVSSSNNVEVRTRTTSRYTVNNPYEDNTGKKRTITGIVDESLAGKQATLFIYKTVDASDYSNEYIGQSVIGKDGTYTFTFKLREEPSIETGDFTVALGVEGSNTVFYLDKILAPLPTYTVRFCDDDGTVLSTQTVVKGESAVLPAVNPEKTGYTFAGWNYSNASIFQDTDIRALYVENEYTITFIDWTNQLFEMHTGLHYGDPILVPEMNYDIPGLIPIGWDSVVDGMTVTENMVVTAKYEQKSVTVNFYDYNDNIISSQTIDYGDSVQPPVLAEDEDYIFLSWDQLYFDEITLDADVYPVYCFSRTCEMPDASVLSGIYDDTISVILTCPTENSVIYYSIDDGELQIYDGPISISETSKLFYYAGSLGYNDSSYREAYYVINKPGETQNWKYPVTVYDEDSVLATYLIPSGETLESVIGEFDKTGYEFTGYYTDADFAPDSVWNVATTAVTMPVFLYAKYNPIKYRVAFYGNNGELLSEQQVDYLCAADTPDNIHLAENQRFIKWDTDDYKCVTGNTDVNAIIRNVDEIAEITLNKDNISTIAGMSYELKATVLPETYANKTVLWHSSNTDVVKVDAEGLITAVSAGTAVVTATLLADEAISAECIVTVKPNSSETICLKENSTLTISRGYLVGAIPSNNTVSALLSEIESNEVVVYSSIGRIMSNSEHIETGSEIRIVDNFGNTIDAVIVIVAGDVYADGYVNNKDASMLLRKTVNKETFTANQLIAADVNADGFVSVKDVAMVLQYIRGMNTKL